MAKLDIYMRFEKIMMELDDQEDPIADKVRDLMDVLYQRLTKEELKFLDGSRSKSGGSKSDTCAYYRTKYLEEMEKRSDLETRVKDIALFFAGFIPVNTKD